MNNSTKTNTTSSATSNEFLATTSCSSCTEPEVSLYEQQRQWSYHVLPAFLQRGPKPDAIGRNRARCMGVSCTEQVLDWIYQNFDFQTVVDPFCGMGTVL